MVDNGAVGYMCLTAFNFELGRASGGVTVYSSEADLRLNRSCVDQCGIVKVMVSLEEVVLLGEVYDQHKKEIP